MYSKQAYRHHMRTPVCITVTCTCTLRYASPIKQDGYFKTALLLNIAGWFNISTQVESCKNANRTDLFLNMENSHTNKLICALLNIVFSINLQNLLRLKR